MILFLGLRNWPLKMLRQDQYLAHFVVILLLISELKIHATVEQADASSSAELKKCFDYLKEGEKLIRIDQKNAILVLGNTGSGKTTLVQFLTGDNTELFAEEVINGNGQFTIIDKRGKISSSDSTMLSKTIFPELFIDKENNIGIYDCPGFDDTRGTATDIAATYFIRKVINNIDQVKIILTVRYSSVVKGSDRSDFLNLIQHILRLIKNIDNYCDSFVIVVTKVDNTYVKNKKTKALDLVSDDVVRESVASFLEMFRKDVVKIKDESFGSKATKLVNALLTKNENSYERIGIFRKPDEEGPLNENKLLQEGKHFIRNILVNSIQYSHIHSNDFGYTISGQSKNEVNNLITHINENIKKYITDICAEIEITVDMKHQQIKNFKNFEAYLINVQRKMDLFKNDIEYETNLKSFARKFQNLIVDLQVRTSLPNFLEILKQGKYLDFLGLVSERKIDGSSSKWRESFRQLTNYLYEMQEWNKFLSKFYIYLTSYKIQKSKSKFTYLYENQISSLGDERMKQFLQQNQNDFNITNTLMEKTLDTTQIITLNNLIISTLNTSHSVEYDETIRGHIISGNHIILSEISNIYLSNNDVFINIFASDKIFIDRNITKTNNELGNLAVIAPTWEVIGTEEIVLDGKNGDFIPPPYSEGQNGIPGLPGHPAANFFGAALNFVHSENLRISTNGGQGGQGQRGADGKPGEDGEGPLFQWYTDGKCRIINLKRFKYKIITCGWKCYYCSYGKWGNNGHDGGDGGIGGHGGHPGNITLVGLDDFKPPHCIVSQKGGSKGQNGMGGTGGPGGVAGTSRMVKGGTFMWYETYCHESDELSKYYGVDCSSDDHLHNGLPGHDGHSGYVHYPLQNPEPVKQPNIGAVLVKYNEFMRGNLMQDDQQKYKFLTLLNQNSIVARSYRVMDLVSEFFNLEHEYQNSNKNFDWLSQYEQLLQLLERQLPSSTKENRVLQSLQKATISKLCLLKVKPLRTLITHVSKYLESVQADLNHLLKEDESHFILNDDHKKLQQDLTESFKEVCNRTQRNINRIVYMADIVRKSIEKSFQEQVTNVSITNEELKQLEMEKNLIFLKVLHGIQKSAQFLKAISTFGAEIINIECLPNKYAVQENKYKVTISRIQDILWQVLHEKQNVPKKYQVFEDVVNNENISSHIKNLIKQFIRFQEVKNLTDILEMRKVRRDLLRELTNVDIEPESLQEKLQAIEIFLYAEDIVPLIVGNNETLLEVAKVLGATLHKSRAYDHIQFYVEKLQSTIEQVFVIISDHLVDEIIDTSRTEKQEIFNDIKSLLQQLQKSVKLPEDLSSIFQQTIADINIISTVYDYLSYYQEFDRLVALQKEMHLSRAYDNDKYKNITNNLDIVTKFNLVMNGYYATLKSIKQIVFPFGDLYMNKFNLHGDISHDINNITNFALYKLQDMKSSIEKEGLYLDPHYTKLIFDREFTNHGGFVLGAFYVWKNNDHKRAIEDLLAGKKVILQSDIINGVPNDAVKFNSIRIKFTCNNEQMQSDLDSDLEGFMVSMIHGEDSYYKCANKFYRFTFHQQELIYSYQTKTNGEPATKNLVYDKIKSGTAVLSPYTQWSIQLIGNNFEKLARYKDWVDLELEGQGQWLKDGECISDTTLQKYYTVDDSIAEASAIDGDLIDLSKVQLKSPNTNISLKLPQLHRVVRSLVEQQSNITHDIFKRDILHQSLLGNVNITKPVVMVNSSNQQKPIMFCTKAQSSMKNCFLLLDLLTRRFTNVKPKYLDHCSSNLLHTKMCAFEIVRDFEKLVEILYEYPHQYAVDPIPVMELVSKDITNANGRNIRKILLNSVKNNGVAGPEFYTQLRSKITQEYSLESEFMETE